MTGVNGDLFQAPACVEAALLADMSLADLKEYGRTADRHDLLKWRWLTYEVFPQLQLDYPGSSWLMVKQVPCLES